MKIRDYLVKKYGNWSNTMLAAEAEAFGIPYPLQAGWIREHAAREVTPEMKAKCLDGLNALLSKAKTDVRASRIEAGIKALADDSPANYRFKSQKPAKAATTPRDGFLGTYEWKRVRMEALKRYGTKCQCCGAGPEIGAVINVDHIKPRRLFPDLALDIENLQVLCSSCNHGKGNWDQTDWRPNAA
jgi:hypothetical protein